jgi:hypothetical protein
MITQYFDTLKSIGESDRTNTLFLAHSPGVVKDLSDQILQSMLVAGKAVEHDSRTTREAPANFWSPRPDLSER